MEAGPGRDELISLRHRRQHMGMEDRTGGGGGGFVWSDHKVTAGRDIGEDASVWVLCQMNNAIGRGISDVPSVWVGPRKDHVWRMPAEWCVRRGGGDVHVQWRKED